MFSTALVLFVVAETGSVSLTSETAAAATLATAVTGPMLDRSRHRRAWIVVDPLGTALVLVLLVTLAHHMPSWVMPVLGAAYGCTTPLTFGGFASSLSEVLAREPAGLVAQASTLEIGGSAAASVVGPAGAGALSGTFGAATAMLTRAAIALAVAALVRSNPNFELPPDRLARVSSLRAELMQGWRAIRDSDGLRATVLAAGLALVALTGLLEGPGLASQATLRRRDTPQELRAQTQATIYSANNASAAAGPAIGGAIHQLALLVIWFAAFGVAAGVIYTTGGAASSRRDELVDRPEQRTLSRRAGVR